MKAISFFLLFFCLFLAPAAAQNVVTVVDPNGGKQSAAELANLERLAREDQATWNAALGTPAQPLYRTDTVLAQYIIYADLDGLVKYAEDVWMVSTNRPVKHPDAPLSLPFARVVMVRYYAHQ